MSRRSKKPQRRRLCPESVAEDGETTGIVGVEDILRRDIILQPIHRGSADEAGTWRIRNGLSSPILESVPPHPLVEVVPGEKDESGNGEITAAHMEKIGKKPAALLKEAPASSAIACSSAIAKPFIVRAGRHCHGGGRRLHLYRFKWHRTRRPRRYARVPRNRRLRRPRCFHTWPISMPTWLINAEEPPS